MRDHVSLILSDEIVSAIVELRDSLVDGLSNADEQLLHHPHVSVASFDGHNNPILPSAIEQFARNQRTFPLTFRTMVSTWDEHSLSRLSRIET